MKKKKFSSVPARLGYRAAYLMIILDLLNLMIIIIAKLLEIKEISLLNLAVSTLIGLICIIRLGGR
ncbi:MAG: hypothetical protein Q4F95_00700 [Oscillospiraceae bacterium]|nr:hypothetical protein [Oscillospiraceae bacterium]